MERRRSPLALAARGRGCGSCRTSAAAMPREPAPSREVCQVSRCITTHIRPLRGHLLHKGEGRAAGAARRRRSTARTICASTSPRGEGPGVRGVQNPRDGKDVRASRDAPHPSSSGPGRTRRRRRGRGAPRRSPRRSSRSRRPPSSRAPNGDPGPIPADAGLAAFRSHCERHAKAAAPGGIEGGGTRRERRSGHAGAYGSRVAFGARDDSPPCPSAMHEAQASFAISRSRNFWIFPVEVFGISAKTTWRGHL